MLFPHIAELPCAEAALHANVGRPHVCRRDCSASGCHVCRVQRWARRRMWSTACTSSSRSRRTRGWPPMPWALPSWSRTLTSARYAAASLRQQLSATVMPASCADCTHIRGGTSRAVPIVHLLDLSVCCAVLVRHRNLCTGDAGRHWHWRGAVRVDNIQRRSCSQRVSIRCSDANFCH